MRTPPQMVTMTCPCLSTFRVPLHRILDGRGIYCSSECRYRFASRPSGLTYNIQVENSAWFKPGHIRSPNAGPKPGQHPPNFLGDEVGYAGLHDWVTYHQGRAAEHACTHCGHDGSEHQLQWANISHEYRRDFSDWMVLCYPCHRDYDRLNGWGAAGKVFSTTPSGSYGPRMATTSQSDQ